MQQNNNTGGSAGGHDLEFATSIDGSPEQNVPPNPQPTNNALSSMTTSSGSSSSYKPSSGVLQFSQSAHPTACLFHILFKGLAFALYILGAKIGMEDIMVTVICILLIAADFWTVKNVTGRLLVGLRWWNKVDPVSGNTSWIFESADVNSAKSNVNAFDSKFFWGILYLTPVLWGLFFLTALLWLQFQCFVTLATALVLSASNVYGYYKCSADQREKWNQWMSTGAQMGVSAMMRNGMFGRLFGGRGSGMQQPPQTSPGTFA